MYQHDCYRGQWRQLFVVLIKQVKPPAVDCLKAIKYYYGAECGGSYQAYDFRIQGEAPEAAKTTNSSQEYIN